MLNLLRLEMRRALHRRAVWALIGVFLTGALIVGVVLFVEAAGTPLTELRAEYPHGAAMADWWIVGTTEGTLLMAAVPMLIGGLLGGATVAGAEWRAGTIGTVLTWEPRRIRLHAARTASAFLLAVVIAFALLVIFLAAKMPAVVAHGTRSGIDGAWWWALLAAMGRVSLLTGLAAGLGVALATVGRSTTFALAAAFGWMAVGEGLARTLRPSLQHHLVSENLAVVITWAPLGTIDTSHSAVTAATLLVTYVGLVSIAATARFARVDIGGAG